MKHFPHLLLCSLSCLLALTPLAASAADEKPGRLDRQWSKIEAEGPELGVRDVMDFILEAVGDTDYQRYRTQAETSLKLLEKKQDLDPASKTYGNFCWYWRENTPGDLNAVEFISQAATVVKLRFYDRLSPEARTTLDRMLEHCIEGIHRQKVYVNYTNIFLMKTWNLLAIGEGLKKPELSQEGAAMFDEWLTYTGKNGIREYLSPTYYATDLDSLGLMAKLLSDPVVKEKAEGALRLFWTNIAVNWFEPAGRLGGAHGRDYDYLTGHGYLDQHLLRSGWINESQAKLAYYHVFLDTAHWTPPANLRQEALSNIPRFVYQKWDTLPTTWASQYVGHRFSIGVTGESHGPEDKPFALNLAGPTGPKMVMASYFMDGRGDPYGKGKVASGASGHKKAHHLIPQFRAVQAGPEVLFMASCPPNDTKPFKPEYPLACLLSHLVLPTEAVVWIGGQPVAADKPSQPLTNNVCFLRIGDVVAGIRFVAAIDTNGQPVTAEMINDGGAYNARRLTVTHSAAAPETHGHGTVAVCVRVAEGLDDAGFAAFRKNFEAASATATTEGSTLRVKTAGLKGPLALDVDLAKGELLSSEGADAAMQTAPMSVNGKEYSAALLQKK